MNVVDRLAELPALAGVPRAELEWLEAHGELRTYERGDFVALKTQPVREMVAVFTGGFDVLFGHGTGRIHKLRTRAGELSGILPFSRLTTAMGDVITVDHTEVLVVDKDHFTELIRECPTITAILVHSMVDRARVATATNWQDEKMISLGRLAAGFAHNLNNPASAVVRSSRHVGVAVTSASQAALALGRAKLSDAQQAEVDALLEQCLQHSATKTMNAIARSDREEGIEEWLESRKIDTSIAKTLGDCNVRVETLEALASNIPVEALGPALHWIAAEQTAHSLLSEVCEAGTRIHDFVSSLTRFTDMDRAAVAHPLDIAKGLADTVMVQEARAALKSVRLRLDIAPNLPRVKAHSADLNQVWSHLLENAIDAAAENGEVTVAANSEPDAVVVRVIDDGPGITPEVQARMFDPFFTTKGEGDGIGFGLDIVRRIVHMHDGEVTVDTHPGRTEFCVRIPVNPAHG